ncbi:poly(A)-specific ribonuclease PARN-like isoform X2 [Thrips palmi]|uniref:Poly(A)-specific ribonuclease PARN-like isoform X2 n=1 Tax=Thrips palmi TaxID=161013 RepID=A0A6P8ZSR6_THRPL|nr:poly(A)-specific ribonuclease PARN-like isoform X2 [Thrips palmi]XP_034248121.1 poly(A)-specific ribonuclease PARN-like isoform X2 [Thrips palmi]
MDVTRKNYYDILPDLKKAVSEAEFISIDLELTGLTTGGRELDAMPFDTPRQYYEKVHRKALDFLPLQLGICIFQYDAKGERYTYQAYNFYTFPFSNLKGFPNNTFQCQSSSLAFLSNCGFDFNKAFGEGIPFLTQQDEDKLRTSIEDRHQKMGRESTKETYSDIPVPDDMKLNLNNNMKKIKEFLDDGSDNRKDYFILDRCNAFMRRLLYQEVAKEFGDAVQLETCDDSSFAMKISRGGGEELRKLREEEKMKKEWKEFEETVGLSHLIKMISESGKLVIGHNCFLDVCHMVNRFRYSLPSNYDNFKELVHHIFPRVLDTKYMSIAAQFKELIPSNVLGHMRGTLSEAPFEMPIVEGNMEGRSYSDLVDKSHEGGYDAFMTGQCFLSMCQYLAKDVGRKLNSLNSISDILENFENRLYLMRVQDVPFMRLGAPDTKPPRNHVFHLKFPREWRQYEVVELFKPFGSVFISFIDDRSAFVALHKRDQAKVVMKTMTGNDTYKVTSFSTFQKQTERKFLPDVQPSSPSLEVLRKRKSRDVSESPDLFKKHRGLEQPSANAAKRSIDPIPEEGEAGGEEESSSSEDSSEKPPKEFEESDIWN